MTDQELLDLNKEGLIPGPGEDEKNFIERVDFTKKRFTEGSWIPDAHWDWVRLFLDDVFDVKPLYICAFYSNKGLTPWQGAASWIEGRRLNSVQLRVRLKRGSYLRMYRREEILAHEAVHGVRCGFNEDRYEEFFAYMVSDKKWRRVLGPILQRPWEAWPFLLCSLGGMFWPICYTGAALWAGLGFCRLIKGHLKLRKASNKVFTLLGCAHKSRAVLFRLTDEEIERFSKGEDVKEYAKMQNELRWRLIRLAYF